MTASDLTPHQDMNPNRHSAAPSPGATHFDKTAQGFAALIHMGRSLTETALQSQNEALRFMRRKQERDIEFLGALASAQNPVTAAGTVADYWQSSLTDWMTEATRFVLELPQSASDASPPRSSGPSDARPSDDRPSDDRIGVLAGPVAPIPGAPDSAPSAQPAMAPPATGGKSRSTPV